MNCPHWLLALTIPFSRSDRAHTSPAGVGAGCAEGLLRTSRRVSFSCRRALGGRSDGIVTVAGASHSVNALSGREHRGATPGCDLSADRSGTSAVTDGCPHERPGSLQAQASRRHQWWHAGGHPAFRMPPGARCATGFPLPLPPIRVGRSVHCPLMPSNYRMSPRCDDCMMNRRCCRVVTGR